MGIALRFNRNVACLLRSGQGGSTLAVATLGRLSDIQRRVVRTLERGGGELSHSELVLSSTLPSHLVAETVDTLKERGLVDVQSPPDSDLELVILKR